MNFIKKPTQYTVKIERFGEQKQQPKPGDKDKDKIKVIPPDFTLENPAQTNITAPAADSYEGTEVSLNIRFEPSTLMETRAILTVSSNEGGEYTCLLIGQSVPPQPKGPYKISGKAPPIPFKNPFFESLEFVIRIDNPAFQANAKASKLDAKKETSITVTYNSKNAPPGTSNNGRLMISTGDLPPWVFYLQGEEEEGKAKK